MSKPKKKDRDGVHQRKSTKSLRRRSSITTRGGLGRAKRSAGQAAGRAHGHLQGTAHAHARRCSPWADGPYEPGDPSSRVTRTGRLRYVRRAQESQNGIRSIGCENLDAVYLSPFFEYGPLQVPGKLAEGGGCRCRLENKITPPFLALHLEEGWGGGLPAASEECEDQLDSSR